MRKHQQQMDALYANTPLVLIWLDTGGQIRTINQGGDQLTVRPREELTGLRYGEALGCIHHLEDAWGCGFAPPCKNCGLRNMVLDTLDDGVVRHMEEVTQTFYRDGQHISMTFHVTTLLLDQETEPLVLVRMWDVTHRKFMEEELERSKDQLSRAQQKAEEGNRLKTSFLSNISHEIRTPINGIMGFAQILLERTTDEPQTKEYLEIIYQQTGKLLKNITDLVEVSRAASDQLELHSTRFNAGNLLYNLKQQYEARLKEKAEAGVSLSVDFPDTVFIRADHQKLRQVLEHLLDNAIKFTPEGCISLGLEMTDEQECRFYVQDTGIGIPKEKQAEVFESFRQVDEGLSRQHPGSGLGLTLAKHYVEIMGGRMGLHSEKDKGSCFYFYIPRDPDNKGVPPIPASMGEDVFNWDKKTFLLVEDDPSSQLYLKEALYPTGAQVLLSETGNQALELMERIRELDLVLMDIRLPDISGLDVIRGIRASGHRVPIIAQTAHAMEEDHFTFLQAGADDYIAKPVSIGDLLSVMARWLGDSSE